MSADAYLTVVDDMRIPVEYLASILSAGDTDVVRRALIRLTAMRAFMRASRVGDLDGGKLLKESGLTADQVLAMARLFGVAKYDERFVIPTAKRETNPDLAYAQGACSLEGIAPPEGILAPVKR